MSQYRSLQTRKMREITERNLIFLLGTLILGGWFVLGLNFLEPSRGLLKLLDYSVGARAIFLVLIPYSISSILVKLIDLNKKICVTRLQILSLPKNLRTNFPSALPPLHVKAKLTKTKLTANWLRLSFATHALFTASFLLGIVCLSGFIGWQKTTLTDTDIFICLLSNIIFALQICRILLIAGDLVKIIWESLK